MSGQKYVRLLGVRKKYRLYIITPEEKEKRSLLVILMYIIIHEEGLFGDIFDYFLYC